MLTLLPIRNITSAQMSELMNVNFLSAARIVSMLIKKGNNDRQLRNVVFVSSTASKFGAKAFSVYSASKGALDAMMRSLAVELAPQVRVNSVLPGGIGTQMTTGSGDPELKERMRKRSRPPPVWPAPSASRWMSPMDHRPAVHHRRRTDDQHHGLTRPADLWTT
jgi:NAD(P)-dependent dehydrogenase (short-subunit alcohol dehydrogenase family)